MIIALVGLPGSGKSEAARILEKKGFSIVRLGDVTDDVLKERKLKQKEDNEKKIREEIREKYGMGGFAVLSLKKIKKHKNVVVDGVISYQEVEVLKDNFEDVFLAAVHSNYDVRLSRINKRKERPLAEKELKQRDMHQLTKLNMAMTFAKADYTIVNDGSIEELNKRMEELLRDLQDLVPGL